MEGTDLTDLCSFKNRQFVRFLNFQIEIGRDFTLNRIFKTKLETEFSILFTFFEFENFIYAMKPKFSWILTFHSAKSHCICHGYRRLSMLRDSFLLEFDIFRVLKPSLNESWRFWVGFWQFLGWCWFTYSVFCNS